jgi:hypothetical protein
MTAGEERQQVNAVLGALTERRQLPLLQQKAIPVTAVEAYRVVKTSRVPHFLDNRLTWR